MQGNKKEMSTLSTCDVVVIGGGISGLCAAKLLQEQYGIDVIVLEARDRVGGRTFTLEDPKIKYTDLGGSYVGPTQDRILRVAKDLGIETYFVYDEGKVVEYLGGKISRYSGEVSTWNPLKILDYYHSVFVLNKMSGSIPLGSPWSARNAIQLDTVTVKEFINSVCWTTYGKQRMTQIFQDAMAAEPHDISLLYYLWYLNSGGGVLRVAAVENAGQERKFKGGSQQISTKIAHRLGEKVILSSPVNKVDQSGESIIVTCRNGKQYQTKYVISAMPQALLNKVEFVPSLPPLKNQLIQRIPMGSVVKTMTFYDRAFWRAKGLSGVLIADDGPVYVTLDDSKPDGSHPAIMGFILGDQARYWCEKTKQERQEAVCQQYAKVFGTDEALTPCVYIDQNWPAEEFSGGCYVSLLPCGVLTKYGKALRESVGNVFFAGTETALVWSGYMDGAVEAGERAAREVLHAMGNITADEIYQDEPPSTVVVAKPCDLTLFQKMLPSVPTFLFGFSALCVSTGLILLKHLLK